ncbi:hypothetical protein DFH09DRAFT_1490300 [Mycena vulgaris]|nr:hypothetical protein DFH09DRAFT_1490300 [Mycena vulgaris]
MSLPAVVTHLRDIFHRLHLIHQARPQASPIPDGLIDSDTESAYEKQLVELEVAIIQHSWDKLKERILKNSRDINFVETADAICGAPAKERVDYPDGVDPSLLDALQKHAAILEIIPQLSDMSRSMKTIREVLESGPSREGALDIRLHLEILLIGKVELETKDEFFSEWNSYTRQRLKKKDSDVLRWLSKAVSIREHYENVADIAISPTLAEMLLQSVQVEALDTPVPNPKYISLDRKRLMKILVKAGATDTDSEETRKATVGQTWSTANLPPCAFCEIYFAAYRVVTGAKIFTRGGRSQTSDWTYPKLVDPTIESELEREVSSKLLATILKGWDSSRRASLSSQSTAVSGRSKRVHSWESVRRETTRRVRRPMLA